MSNCSNISGPLTLMPNKYSCEVSKNKLGMITKIRIGKIHIIDDKSTFDAMNVVMRNTTMFRGVIKSLIMNPENLVFASFVSLKLRRRGLRVVNKKPNLRKSK